MQRKKDGNNFPDEYLVFSGRLADR